MSKKNEPVSLDLSLEEIGDALRQQRDKQQLTLQDCAERLKIRHRYLNSLEQGSPDSLPGDVFYINFVKSYAMLLGLDGEDFAGKARKALQAQGRLKELESVTHTQPSAQNNKPPQAQSAEAAPVESNLALGLGEGGAFQAPPLSMPSGVVSLPFSSEGRIATPPLADAATEKQVLRETLLSPLFVIGGIITAVLLYLGAVIVSDILGEGGGGVVSAERAVSLAIDEEPTQQLEEVEVVEDVRASHIYGAVGSTRVELWAKEVCWIAVFATDTSLDKRDQAELLFAETLLEGDRYRVPAELGIVLKGGNLSCVTFVVQGVVVDPFRITNPSGFMSLEPSHLRARTAVREGGVLARERLPVVLEIELLRQQRAEQALEQEGKNP